MQNRRQVQKKIKIAQHATDQRFMREAIVLAERNWGATRDNPSVGCVIVKDGRVVGRGTTGIGGRPHAEVIALAEAGALAHQSIVYVTLEPCCHIGRSSACSRALINAGISNVVIACTDPNPLVSGKGIAELRSAGITVRTGVLEDAAKPMLAGFFHRMTTGKPLVLAKVACSLDGSIAMESGESRWITSVEARAKVQLFRARADAILTAAGTVIADDPELTVRDKSLAGRSPIRVVVDPNARCPLNARIFNGDSETIWVTAKQQTPTPPGVRWLAWKNMEGLIFQLGEEGINTVMVEGGQTLLTSLLDEDRVDQLAWFTAPIIIGANGLKAVGSLNCKSLADVSRWRPVHRQTIGVDEFVLLERFTAMRSVRSGTEARLDGGEAS
jgi:diaminohydroxyphosphoribosylaminopyrimidine deaminase / 5-amino-6-(5-phosphoribosylamino)uracil reductase